MAIPTWQQKECQVQLTLDRSSNSPHIRMVKRWHVRTLWILFNQFPCQLVCIIPCLKCAYKLSTLIASIHLINLKLKPQLLLSIAINGQDNHKATTYQGPNPLLALPYWHYHTNAILFRCPLSLDPVTTHLPMYYHICSLLPQPLHHKGSGSLRHHHSYG